jgi:hypothetical protein
MAVVNPPAYLESNTIQHNAMLLRRALQGVLGAPGVATFTAADLKVSQSGTPGLSVDIARGGGFVKGTDQQDQGFYFVYNDANLTLSGFTPDSTNPRLAIVVFRVFDTTDGQSGDTSSLSVILGTPNAVPVAPATPASALLLATVRINAGVTSILNAQITDNRVTVGKLFSGAKVNRTSDDSGHVPNALDAIQWQSEAYDQGSYFTTGANTRLTVPSPGEYAVSTGIQMENSDTSGIRRVDIYKNGSAVAGEIRNAPTDTSVNFSCTVVAREICIAGDYFEVYVLHKSGATLKVQTSGRTWFAIEKIG